MQEISSTSLKLQSCEIPPNVFLTFVYLRSLYVIHPRPSPMLLLLLCFSRCFYHFSCPGLLQLSVSVFLSVLLSFPSPASPPATNQIQIDQTQIWHFLVRKKNHLKRRSSRLLLFSFEFLWLNSKFPCYGNWRKFQPSFLYRAKFYETTKNNGNILESSYAAYFCFRSHDMVVIFLTFVSCFFFSLPKKKRKNVLVMLKEMTPSIMTMYNAA